VILLRLRTLKGIMAGMRAGSRTKVMTAAVAAAITASLAGVAISLSVHVADRQSVLSSAMSGAVVVALVLVGAVVASARPGNRVGWLMLAGGVLWALGNASADAAYRGIVAAPGSVTGASAFAVAGSVLRGIGWWAVALGLPMFFPDGRIIGPRWRWLPKAALIVVAGSLLGVLTAADANVTGLGSWRNPTALPSSLQAVSGLLSIGSLFLGAIVTVGAVVQLSVRWRRGGLVERQQLTLFAMAATLPIVAAPIALGAGVGGWLFSVATLPLPFTIGFAVLAHGLYDLRTAANRTLVWVTLSAVVAGLYALVIAGVGGRFNAGDAIWLPWAAAVVVAISFAPLRDGLQSGVNRLIFGRWDEPYDVLAVLGQRLEAAADVDRLLVDAVTELRALGLDDVSIHEVRGHIIAGDAQPAIDTVTMPLFAYGHQVGALHYRPPMSPLRARDRRLLGNLAGHLGGVLHAYQLTGELQRARERLVLAREEERRRLRRDLHDGLGPALAGHLLRLDVIAGKVGRRSPAAADVDTLRKELRATVFEVRRVVEGLRPPALDELGLVGALKQVTQRLTAGITTTVDLQVAELPSLPAATEVAVFRIVTEAVTNAVRHADAATCRVIIDVTEGMLRIRVIDDGRGLGTERVGDGHGLQTMRERVEELRGRLQISSANGTTIFAELPLPAAHRPIPDREPSAGRP